jgi:hypothetical protein
LPPVAQEPAAPPIVPGDDSKVRENPPQTGGGGAPAAGPSGQNKVSYWLNRTENNNCLTIQPQGSASVSAKCSLEGATLEDWIAQDLTNAGVKLSATIRIETKNATTKQNFVSASDNTGEQNWRWRCVKTKDVTKQISVHTICYEDGNALNKVFESSDLFVRFTGPETVELTGVKCTAGNDIDMVTCTAK